MVRMRSMLEAVEELKASDPNTAITYHSLRQMVLRGEVPSLKIGRKRLVNMDILERHLCFEDSITLDT